MEKATLPKYYSVQAGEVIAQRTVAAGQSGFSRRAVLENSFVIETVDDVVVVPWKRVLDVFHAAFLRLPSVRPHKKTKKSR